MKVLILSIHGIILNVFLFQIYPIAHLYGFKGKYLYGTLLKKCMYKKTILNNI